MVKILIFNSKNMDFKQKKLKNMLKNYFCCLGMA